MRRAGVLFLFVVAAVLAGCPADGDGEPETTVTAAEVPTVQTVPPTPTPRAPPSFDCDVSSPSAVPASNPYQPTGPASIPLEDGVVDGSALVDRHETALANYSYRLERPDLEVRVAGNRSAFLANVNTGSYSISHYAVDGTRYTHYFQTAGRQRYGVSAYEAGESISDYGGSFSVTGRQTIERVLAVAPHRVADVRPNNWTVLRATIDERTLVAGTDVESLESTILVDRRGIVRQVETRLRPASDEASDLPLSGNTSLSIGQIGDATFDRPDWVCRAAPGVRNSGPADDRTASASSPSAATPSDGRDPPA